MASNGAAGAAANAMAAPAWRQFQFFSQTPIRDHHAPSAGSPEVVRQPALISTLHADEELMLLADLDGSIHQLSPDYEVLRSWRVYGDGAADGRCTHIRTVRGWKGVVVTLGEDPASPFPTIKIWSLSTTNTTSSPTLLRSARINPTSRPHPVSSLAIAPGLTHVVLGLADGTVVAFRHVDQLVEASLAGAGQAAVNGAGGGGANAGVLGLGKLKVLYEGKEPITDLGIAGMGAAEPSRRGASASTTLFILTTSHVLSYPITSSSSKASATVLDDLGSGVGCSAVMRMAGGEKMIVARDEAIYVYGAEGREGCYAYEGPKSAIRVLSSSISSSPSSSSRSTYLAIVSPPLVPTAASTSATIRNYARGLVGTNAANGAGGASSATDVAKVTIFDPENKFVAHSGTFEEGVRDVWEAWGSVWVLSEGGKLFRLSEQPLATSLSTLFSRNLYTLAISLAQSRKLSPSEVAEIYRRYGDHLYSKSDYEGAMGCYLKTVGTVQASYVIRKFLDAQRLSHLTSYLQELHSRGLANSDHTTLLLNCYTKLADDTALSSFIHSSSTSGSKQRLVPLPNSGSSDDASAEEPPFDLETAIRVCRQAGYFEHAVWLAERYGEHQEYLRIQIEDRADFGDALAYLRRLGTEVAKDSLVRYGKTLLAAEPKATTALLVDLCCGTLSKGKEPESSEEEKENGAAKKAAATESKGYMSLLAYGTSAEPSLPTPPTPTSASPAPPPLAAGPRSNSNDLRTNESAANNRKSGLTSQYHVPDVIPSPTPIEEDVPSPRQFFAHYVDHPHEFITFLETIAERRYGKKVDDGSDKTSSTTPLPKPQPLRALEFDDAATRDEQAIWNTLLELYVSHGSSSGQGDHSEVVLQAKALRLLRARERIPYDETQALLVCSTQGFVPGFILLYEQLGMYDDIVRYWIDSSQASSSTSSDSSKVIQALHRYGPSHPHLYRMVLRYLTTSSELLSRHQSDITEILDDIDRDKILPPIAVVQILSTNGTASIGLVREYLKKQLTAEKQEIDSDQGLIASYRTESATKRKEIHELSDPNVPRIFQVTRCSACGGQLDLPAVHFMCRHSYHQRCLGENESQCPNCARTHGVVREIRKNNEQFAGRHDLFLGEVAESADGFATVAAAFSKGVMGLAGSAGDS